MERLKTILKPFLALALVVLFFYLLSLSFWLILLSPIIAISLALLID